MERYSEGVLLRGSRVLVPTRVPVEWETGGPPDCRTGSSPAWGPLERVHWVVFLERVFWNGRLKGVAWRQSHGIAPGGGFMAGVA